LETAFTADLDIGIALNTKAGTNLDLTMKVRTTNTHLGNS